MIPLPSALILVIDPAEAHVALLRLVLQDLGETLLCAATIDEACILARTQEFAAIVLDISLQNEAYRLRAEPRTQLTPLLFTTAFADPGPGLEAIGELGLVDVVSLPLMPSLLRAKFAFFLDLYRSKDKLRLAERAVAQGVIEQERRREAEAFAETLRATQERLRLATEAGGLGVWMWDVTKDLVTWEHDWMYDMFGMSKDEGPLTAARFASEFLHPDDRAEFSSHVSQVLAEGGAFKFAGRFFRQNDRAMRWVEFNGARQPSTDDAQPWLMGTVAEITERKRADQELRTSEERYRTLFDSIDEGFCVLDVIFNDSGEAIDYRFIEHNPAFEKQAGMENVMNRSIRELVPGHEGHWFDVYGRVARSGKPERFVREAKNLGRWFDVYATPTGGPGSTKLAVLFTDITERKHAEVEFQRLAAELAEADRRKTEFLATLAHELRNPLAPIRNGLQIMRLGAADEAGMAQVHDMMERQIGQMVHLINDLLDIARISNGQVELRLNKIDLQTLVDSAVETSLPLIEEGHHTLKVSLPEEPVQLQVDPTRIAQVLSNLLNNAAKYTPANGRIELSAQLEGSDVLISVTDSGVGIPQEALGTIFDMFTQGDAKLNRPQGGLGIGLSVARSLVELHGGMIQAESGGKGLGSTFVIRLARLPSATQLTHAPSDAHDTKPASARRVMVVDDNKDAADTLAVLLELDGHQTVVAHDGDEALRMAPEFQPELVFLDIGMPIKNGYEVAREMRQIPGMRDIVLAALTGWGTDADRARSKDAGFDHHMTKPADLESIDAVIMALAPRAASKGPQSQRTAVSSAL